MSSEIEKGIRVAERYRRRFGFQPDSVVGFSDSTDKMSYELRSIDEASRTARIGYTESTTNQDIEKTAMLDELVDVNIVRKVAVKKRVKSTLNRISNAHLN